MLLIAVRHREKLRMSASGGHFRKGVFLAVIYLERVLRVDVVDVSVFYE